MRTKEQIDARLAELLADEIALRKKGKTWEHLGHIREERLALVEERKHV